MDRLRAAVVAACSLLLVGAGVLVLAPGILGPAQPVIADIMANGFANTGLAIAIIGLMAGIGGAAIANGSSGGSAVRPDLDRLLGGVDATPAGATLEERLEQLAASTSADERAEHRSSIREEVARTTVAVLEETDGLTPAAARRELEAGRWTADPQAAAFFSRQPAPWRVRIREWLSAPSSVELRLDRVLAALEDRLALDAASATADVASHPGTETADEPTTHGVERSAGAVGADDRAEETVRLESTDFPATSTLVGSRRFGLSVGLVAVALGLFTGVLMPFVLGVLAVGHSVAKYLTTAPAPRLAVTRVLGSDSPVPGDRVEVELTVENAGDRPVPDLRVIDGPPEALRVVDGSPSMLTSLQPGGTARLRYTIEAKRGTFTFGDTHLATRDLTNVDERPLGVTVPMRLTGATLLDDLALEAQASQRIGAVKADRSGSGVEFYGTREYREGDPLSRVNWSHLAKTGVLTTVEFREQRSPTIAIVLDQREEARVATAADALDGVDLGVYAAEQAVLTLLDSGTEVGLITYGERLTDVEPASDATQRALLQSRLRAATERYAAALGESAVDATGAVFQRLDPTPDQLDQHVPPNAQVLVLSPATDDFALEATERLSAFGHPTTLLSPAVAGTGTLGGRHRRVDRDRRLRAIRDQGVRVVDWQPDEPIQLAIARATDAATGGP